MNKVLGIVTGSSKGFGQAICQELINGNPNKEQLIDFVLFARSVEGLNQTQQLIEGQSKQVKVISSTSLEMSNIQLVESTFQNVLNDIKWNDYSKICFFNNHGTLFSLSKAEDYIDYSLIQKENDTNTTSFVVTTSLLLKKLKSLKIENQNFTPEITFVNSSSLCAIKAFAWWGLYCASRSYRDMFFQTVALENASNEKFKVLNYSLGILDTNMQIQVREQCSPDDKDFYQSLKTENKLINPNTSAAILSKLVYNNQFESGSHLDYYDLSK